MILKCYHTLKRKCHHVDNPDVHWRRRQASMSPVNTRVVNLMTFPFPCSLSHWHWWFVKKKKFLHDRPWISLWIKSISNELDITCHVLSSQLSGHCDVIANQLWRHQQNVKRASETRGWCVKILILAPFVDSLCHVRNKIMYVLLWRTVYALTRVLFWSK